jgi:hypothetical protein
MAPTNDVRKANGHGGHERMTPHGNKNPGEKNNQKPAEIILGGEELNVPFSSLNLRRRSLFPQPMPSLALRRHAASAAHRLAVNGVGRSMIGARTLPLLRRHKSTARFAP